MDTESLDSGGYKGHLPCPNCGSSDALTDYGDHTFCFSCDKRETTDTKEKSDKFLRGSIKPLVKRKIHEETCKKWDYRIASSKGESLQVANYRNRKGSLVGQKIRRSDKTFYWVGESSKEFWGQHLWQKGRRITITEGEIDALSVSQINQCKWPCVSLPNGVASARRVFKENLEWLSNFDEVVICFDQDDQGKKAAEECASILKPGQGKIVNLPLKDANEMLVENRVEELNTALWEAKPWRPDGIVNGEDLWKMISKINEVSTFSYPYSGLNMKLSGMRKQEILCLCGGTGQGKSQLAKELAAHLLSQNLSLGFLALEESVQRSATGLLGIYLDKPIHLGKLDDSLEELEVAFEATGMSKRLHFYDHWGSLDENNLLSKLRFMAVGLSCDFIILDHISIVVSGMDSPDERRTIDNLMTSIRSFVQESGVGMILVSHLKRPLGNRGHEEGAVTSVSQLRGSHAIAQLSDAVIGMERDQQGSDPDLVTIRVLKNRFSGLTGPACLLKYDHGTGRLKERESDEMDF